MQVDDDEPRVDRDDERPLHVQIQEILRHEIRDRLSPGSSLPTEAELQQRFGVSRSVVRQALASLASLGIISRQRGRGSVVTAEPVLHRHVDRAGGLREQAEQRGQQLRTHVLSVERATAPEPARAVLGTSEAWKIERVRYLEGTPVIFMRTLVPHARFPHFTAELLEGASLLGLMREHGCIPSGGPRQVQAVPADQDLARALDVSIGEPLLLLEGVTRDEHGDGLESFSVWHRAGTVFDVDAHVTSEPAAVASQDDVRRLRLLAQELHSTLAQLDANAP